MYPSTRTSLLPTISTSSSISRTQLSVIGLPMAMSHFSMCPPMPHDHFPCSLSSVCCLLRRYRKTSFRDGLFEVGIFFGGCPFHPFEVVQYYGLKVEFLRVHEATEVFSAEKSIAAYDHNFLIVYHVSLLSKV